MNINVEGHLTSNKTVHIPHPLLAVLFLALLPTPSLVAGGVSVTVKEIDESPKKERPDKEDKKEKKLETDVEAKKLQIQIRNLSGTELSDLKVKYYFFGREAGEPGYKIISQGEKATPLAGAALASIETEVVTAKFTESGYVGKGADRKKVDAKGQKLTGYGVQAVQGDTVLGEFFSASNYRDLVTKK